MGMKRTVQQTGGFTLLEIIISIAILAAVAAVTFASFSAVAGAWTRSKKLSDNLHHGDFIIEQLIMAVRSAYFLEGSARRGIYGFQNGDEGDGSSARDWISWVKTGKALVGDNCPFATTPHRIKFSLVDDDDKSKVAVTAWPLFGQKEDFNPDEVEPIYLPSTIIGFNCRAAYRKIDGEIEWLDVWKETNRLPTVLEVTFYLEPLQEGDEPVEIRRLIRVPLGVVSWR